MGRQHERVDTAGQAGNPPDSTDHILIHPEKHILGPIRLLRGTVSAVAPFRPSPVLNQVFKIDAADIPTVGSRSIT